MANIFCLQNNTGSRFYRLIPQLKEMQERGHKVILEPHDTQNVKEKIDWADIVIFQMVFSQEWVQYAKEKKKMIVFECDDLIHSVPKDHYSYKETAGLKNQIKWWWRMFRTIGRCDGFISTCENLNRVYGRLAKKSLVFKNYIDIPHWLKEYQPNQTDRIRILFAGSTSHTPDLKWIKPVLKRILEKYAPAQFIYIGTGGIKSKDLQARFIYGEDLFEGLPDNRESMLSYPPNVWPYILASLGADIAIAPLVKNYFNKFKSTCKALEYGINKIPGVYSKWFYKGIIKDGYNGFLADSSEEWIEKLSILIEDAKLRKQIGENIFQDVLNNYDIRKFINQWCKFIENL